MLNVDQITSRLAKMPDQALQQYAAMHKNDPYVMALAMSESNRRKQIRQAAQGQQGGEQPKVVDQALAEMAPQQLPEDSGIARLPAGDMNFADGGIVAFAGGGTPYQPGMIKYGGPYGGAPMTGKTGYEGMSMGEFAQTAYVDALRKLGLAGKGDLTPAEKRAAEAEANKIVAAQGKEYSPEDYGVTEPAPKFAGSRLSGTPLDAQPPAADAAAGKPAAPAAPTDQRIPPSTRAGATASSSARASGPGMAMGPKGLQGLYADIYAKQDYKDPAGKEVEALGRSMVEGAERRVSAFDADEAKQGDVFKARADRLKAREGELSSQKDTNTGLAFLNAGLAIMSTPGGLAKAIGKGARVGTEQYAAGLDKIRAAQERLGEANDRLEELRLNRSDMTAKERRALTADVDRAKQDAQRLGIDGIRTAAGVNEKRASEIFGKTVDAQLTMFREGEANKRSAASSRNSQLEIIEALGRDPKLLATYQAMRSTKGEDGVMDEYTKFLKENPTYMGNPQAGIQAFMQAKAALSPLSSGVSITDKPTGKVRD